MAADWKQAREEVDAAMRRRAQDEDHPVELDLGDMARRDPEPPAFIVPDMLPAGEITLLAANGGTGKSATGLHLGVCLATTRAFHGLPVLVPVVDFLSF